MVPPSPLAVGLEPVVEVTYEPSALVVIPAVPLSWAIATSTSPDNIKTKPAAMMTSRFT
jgi:hypothetical protein